MYKVKGSCSNCDFDGNVSFPKGELADFSKAKCPTCGCTTLAKANEWKVNPTPHIPPMVPWIEPTWVKETKPYRHPDLTPDLWYNNEGTGSPPPKGPTTWCSMRYPPGDSVSLYEAAHGIGVDSSCQN